METDKINPESINEREERILKFWQDNKIFEKSLEAPGGGLPKGEFVFYDGPPFATGLPHYGHILPTTIKDVIPRYKTMKGYHVDRVWGWDCHGLPIENLIEGELGLKTKKDIEELGIAKFNEAARDSVLRYEKDWKDIIPRVGRWVDMENDYKTMDWKYTESIWWIFKTLFDRGLIYEGYKSMHLCPRCETTLANFEVNQGYKDITDISVTVRFKIKAKNDEWKNTSVLVWTTTPWTLPGNVALAINPAVVYCKVKNKKEKTKDESYFVLAKERLAVLKDEYEIMKEFNGEKLVGMEYEPFFDYYAKDSGLKNRENGWKIYGADFVTTTDGTGIVHIAPAFGEDDMSLGAEENLPFIQHVGTDGKMKKEVVDFAGLRVKPKDPATGSGQETHQSTDVEIIKNLAHRGLLFSKEKVVHSYPHCWRCDTPLLNYAASSWFVKVTEFKDRLIANNQKTNWVPENLRDGRFGKWLEGARDWAISRTRYWGAPLPVWRCDSCKKVETIGSLGELKKKITSGNKFFIARHGESQSVKNNRLDSDPNSGNSLTKKGEEDVRKSAVKLADKKIDLIFASSFLRTKQTAEIIADVIGFDKSKIIYDKRLWELNTGEFSGGPVRRYWEFFTSLEERFTKKSPGGESHTEVKNRVMDFLYETDSKYNGKNILIVSHGDPIWMMIVGAAGATPEEAVKIREGEYLSPSDIRELDFTPIPHNKFFELDLHKPYIDEIYFSCACGGQFKRISEVFDCWFESGSMPYASVHYPFENKKKFEENFPAHFIAEGLDQTRGWFYSLMVLSTALFDKPAFWNVVVNGLILAEDGQKMSKRLKNYPDVMYIVDKYGADALRFYIVSSPAVRAEDLRFSEKGIDEVYKKLILRLQNVLSFYELYAGESEAETMFVGSLSGRGFAPNIVSALPLDTWILARLSSLGREVEKHLENYELDRASRPIMDFVDDLSTWYLRRSRDRFKSDNEAERNSAIQTTHYILLELSKIIAPFAPFLAEDVYQRVYWLSNQKQGSTLEKVEPCRSVHLEEWPSFDEVAEKEKIFGEMSSVRQIVSLALDERKRLGIAVRQPLAKLKIKNEKLKKQTELLQLVKDEVNVKDVFFDEKLENEVWLDTEITPELKDEGNLREFIRALQDMRKKAGLRPDQKVTLNFWGDDLVKSFIKKFESEIKKATNLNSIDETKDAEKEIKMGVGRRELTIKISLI